jgi:hypothetical protein
MLESWIIEKIREEEKKQYEDPRPVLHLPVPEMPEEEEVEETNQTPAIIEISL